MSDGGRLPRLLVVDDEQDVREMMCAVLSSQGYEVTSVENGASALAAAQAERFDLATLDLRMPGLSGRETLAALRQVSPRTAAVVVSGYVTQSEAQACRALGAFAVVSKPFNVDALVRILELAREERERAAPLGP
jgi:CheY-like chemotaxis protein